MILMLISKEHIESEGIMLRWLPFVTTYRNSWISRKRRMYVEFLQVDSTHEIKISWHDNWRCLDALKNKVNLTSHRSIFSVRYVGNWCRNRKCETPPVRRAEIILPFLRSSDEFCSRCLASRWLARLPRPNRYKNEWSGYELVMKASGSGHSKNLFFRLSWGRLQGGRNNDLFGRKGHIHRKYIPLDRSEFGDAPGPSLCQAFYDDTGFYFSQGQFSFTGQQRVS